MNAGIELRMRKVFAEALRMDAIPAGEILREKEPRWDSLRHVNLIFAIEDEFGVSLTEAEMTAIDSLAKAIALLEVRDAA